VHISIISALLLALALTAASHALLTKTDSRSALGWVAFCLFLPLAGPITYLIFGINRLKEKANKAYFAQLETDITPSIRDPEGTAFRPRSSVGEAVTARGLRACDSLELLENGDALYPAMLQAIESAEHKIYLSSYIFDNDTTGRNMVAALASAQQRGADVRVILDGLGEYMSLPRIGHRMRRENINFVRFIPITLIPPAIHINMRNHRKILVVDSKVGFTGGQNIGDRHLMTNPREKHRVPDLHFRLTGKVVDELERAFLRDWVFCRGQKDAIPFQPQNENRQQAPVWTRVIMDGPNEHMDRLNDLLIGIISTAKTRVWIMTPYFLPGPDIVAALVGAKLRGVDIKILLPARNNIFLVHWAMQKVLPYFVKKGIEVRLQPGSFIHTKALIIDHDYALIGSANLDARSLRLNFELNLEVFSETVNEELTHYFEKKLKASKAVTEEALKAVPVIKRLRNALAWLFSPYL